MKIKNIHILINPSSGNDEPILSYINEGFKNSEINWEVSVIQHSRDIEKAIKKKIKKVDLFVAYGGDGTVTQVAKELINTKMPMAIIPGGTANILAKELGIPIDSKSAIELIKSQNFQIKRVDTGLVNDKPFLLRINFGIMAEMVSHTDRELKNSFGQLAYGISAFQTIEGANPIVYKMKIDGVIIEEKGVSLTITNSGNIGIEGYSFLPNITMDDGFFDVILLNNSDVLSLMRVASSTLMQIDSEVLKRWKCKNISILLNKKTNLICDDFEISAKKINISIVPQSLNILTNI